MITFLQLDPYAELNADQSGLLASLGIGAFIGGLLLYLFMGYCFYKIFQKAGYSQPIAGFIPIWNTFALVDISKKKWWWGIIMLIPYVNIIALVMVCIRLSKFFGKSDGFTVGLILLGIVFFPILAFSDAVYNPEALPDERVEN